jgi:cytochrome b561
MVINPFTGIYITTGRIPIMGWITSRTRTESGATPDFFFLVPLFRKNIDSGALEHEFGKKTSNSWDDDPI